MPTWSKPTPASPALTTPERPDYKKQLAEDSQQVSGDWSHTRVMTSDRCRGGCVWALR